MQKKFLSLFLSLMAILVVSQVVFASKFVDAARLPKAPVMEARLLAVLDEPIVRSRYYPLLIRHAGQNVSPQEVVDIFDQETEAFLKTFSASESKMVRVQIVPRIIPLIRNLLKEYPEEAEEAVQIHIRTERPPQTVP
jgi:hypothetical protein